MATETLDPVAGKFVVDVSQETEIDPRVLIAWIAGEGEPGPQGFNYLNIAEPTAQFLGYRDVGTLPADTAAFTSLAEGEAATVAEINSLGLHEQGKTPQQAIADIANSGWASSHYGNPPGANLDADFAARFTQAGLTSAYQPPSAAQSIVDTVGTGSAANLKPGGSVSDAANAILETPGQAVSAAANAITGGVFGPLVDFVKADAAAGLAYVVLTLLGVALVGFGLFELLGYSPGRVVAAASPVRVPAGRPGSTKLAPGDSIPWDD